VALPLNSFTYLRRDQNLAVTVKENRNVFKIGCVKDKEGNIMTDDVKLLEVCKMHYGKLRNEACDWDRKSVAS